MIAFLSIVLAQSCAAWLPPTGASIQWLRNGEPYAVDRPVSSAGNSRVFTRTYTNGRKATRAISCGSSPDGAIYVDKVGDDVIRIPLGLKPSASRRIGNTVVRRLAANGASGTWYSLAQYRPTVVVLQSRFGIEQIRVQEAGKTEVYSAALVQRRELNTAVAQQPEVRRLQEELMRARQRERLLHDSIARLIARQKRTAGTLAEIVRSTLPVIAPVIRTGLGF